MARGRFDIDGRRLEYARWGPADPARATLVFLHEGLGCLAAWRDWPRRLAAATGCGALAYSRAGYGGSDPLAAPFDARFMHREAEHVLPAVLAAANVRRPLLVGHSDGASIALIYAGLADTHAVAVVAEAPHLFVEAATTETIARLDDAFAEGPLGLSLRRRHGKNAEPTFHAWRSVWLSDAFRDWTIEPSVARIHCPVLALQGTADPYGTVDQVAPLRRLPHAEVHLLEGCGHAPHRERPDATARRIVDFVGRVGPPQRPFKRRA